MKKLFFLFTLACGLTISNMAFADYCTTTLDSYTRAVTGYGQAIGMRDTYTQVQGGLNIDFSHVIQDLNAGIRDLERQLDAAKAAFARECLRPR